MAAPLAKSLRRARLRRLSSLSTPAPTSRPRCIASYSHAKAQVQSISRVSTSCDTTSNPTSPSSPPSPLSSITRVPPDVVACAATVRRAGQLSPTYFEATGQAWMPLGGGRGDQEPVDPNKAKLGKTLRILQDRMPTLLQAPLPQDILAPTISLQLFPSTHPHLPTVSGRVAYTAALWTSPIAWNRVPLVGNVRLEILAERMTSEPLTFLPRRPGAAPDQLVVRWREAVNGGAGAAIARSLRLTRGGTTISGGKGGGGGSAGAGADSEKAFTGLFIFDFDREGRILTHTIETAQEGGNWERGVGAKFVGLTDWLLGGIHRGDPGGTPPMPMFERRRRT
ncbi:chromosome transmission fidelity protein 4 [Cordyceps javanica]|uniref:Chromosome transmission fidelity protein 4 n=1 Tax=Cordyceps javanica TaxID=43265 RepID=A0A545VY40_9HYPO|nr:chromosome transmission fidelity protein 4 [Cordyceps javanica]TQW06641.1 chromosome transmission fidelity protein 4 [Cordyceps javanica]